MSTFNSSVANNSALLNRCIYLKIWLAHWII